MGLALTHALGGLTRPLGGPRNQITMRSIFRKYGSGIWYDPQDLRTMYQDATGTLPVYRPGSGSVDPPVGLLLDKSLGLELGPELTVESIQAVASGGTLTDNGDGTYTVANNAFFRFKFYLTDLCNSSVYKTSVEVLSSTGKGVYVNFSGVSYAETAASGYFYLISIPRVFDSIYRFVDIGAPPGGTCTFRFVSTREIKGIHAAQRTTTARPTLSGRYNLLTATAALSTQSVTTAATDYTLSFSGTGTITLSGTATGTYSAGTHTITCTAGSLTCTVAGAVTNADLRVKRDGSSLPAYQSVTNANTYDTAGFPLYLKRDLTDDKHTLIVPTGGITGTRLQTTLDTVSTTSETMAAGAFDMFSVPSAGPREITQWLQFGKVLSASELAIAERFSKSRARLV